MEVDTHELFNRTETRLKYYIIFHIVSNEAPWKCTKIIIAIFMFVIKNKNNLV